MDKKNTKTLHPRNFHNERYDFEALIKNKPTLASFVRENKYGDLSIDFASRDAVLVLNQALLAHFYNIENYELPKDALIAPIPGRADYLHYIADLLSACNDGEIPRGEKIVGLDIGTGANCIYPILGSSIYDWNFVTSDIEELSIKSALRIIDANELLDEKIECRLQSNKENIFNNIFMKKDRFDFTLCNPPFHTSAEEASLGSQRKVRNLTKNKNAKKSLNFAGVSNELWCEGGEITFIKKMIRESVEYGSKCFYFTTLVSKKENLKAIYKVLKAVKPVEVKTIEMKQGQKISRFVAWTFLSKAQQTQWRKERWS
ncbi:MAG: 23S rRNA (adenine(1618)-N(6))-methyltransferase RlmF [Campylobacterota bacterium]|nr:23S rRNA (adenine(1618)-N(6))-methyltransferase RlmF [Campylobacterota bacterium]